MEQWKRALVATLFVVRFSCQGYWVWGEERRRDRGWGNRLVGERRRDSRVQQCLFGFGLEDEWCFSGDGDDDGVSVCLLLLVFLNLICLVLVFG